MAVQSYRAMLLMTASCRCAIFLPRISIHAHHFLGHSARLIATMADESNDPSDVSRRSPGTICYVAALDTTLRTPSPEPYIEVSLSHLLQTRQGCRPGLWAFPIRRLPRCSRAALLPVSTHSLRLCIGHQRGQCQGCRGVWAGRVVVGAGLSSVLLRYNPGGKSAVEKP